jgi:hypothetical protein
MHSEEAVGYSADPQSRQVRQPLSARTRSITRPSQTQRPGDCVQQRLVVKGLLEEGNGAGPQRLFARLLFSIGGDEEDGDTPVFAVQPFL